MLCGEPPKQKPWFDLFMIQFAYTLAHRNVFVCILRSFMLMLFALSLLSISIHYSCLGKIVINPFLFGSELQEGMRSMVLCTVLSKNVEPPLSFLWLKDGKPLQSVHPDAETVQIDQFTTSLTLSNIERRHAGNYTCRATSASNPHIWSTFTSVMVVLGKFLLNV